MNLVCRRDERSPVFSGSAGVEVCRPLKILVVEDNVVNQKVLVHMLRREGHEADVANDGREALDMAREIAYDLILMDCQMPEMDGFEATRAIRTSRGANASTAIVAVTANAFSEDRRLCLEAGMNDHIAKPVTIRRLAAAIEEWVPAFSSTPIT